MFRNAKYLSNGGKVQTVTVDEMDQKFRKSISSKQKNFICPDCGEYVEFVHREAKSSFFRHEQSEVQESASYIFKEHLIIKLFLLTKEPVYHFIY